MESLGEHRARLELDVGQPVAEPPDEVVGDVGRTVGHGEQVVEVGGLPVDLVDEGQLVEVLLGGGDAAVVVSRVVAGEEGEAPLTVDSGADVGRPPVGRPRRIVLEPERLRHRHRRRAEPPVDAVLHLERDRVDGAHLVVTADHEPPREVAVAPVTSASTIQVSRDTPPWRAARR